jgi:hypothetical protein
VQRQNPNKKIQKSNPKRCYLKLDNFSKGQITREKQGRLTLLLTAAGRATTTPTDYEVSTVDNGPIAKSAGSIAFLFSPCYLLLEKLPKSLIPHDNCPFFRNYPPVFVGICPCFRDFVLSMTKLLRG